MNKDILRLAVPNIIANITVPLLGMVDLYIVGHLSSELFIAAIAVASMIFNFIYWNFSFLRMGTSGFTAQAYGADDREESRRILFRSLAVAAAAAVLILLLQSAILRAALAVVKATEPTATYIREYFRIYIWAAPAALGMYAFTGWFIGMQDTRTPMFISIGINAVNICVSLLLVFVFNLEIRGVALGSLIAQYAGIIACLAATRIKYRRVFRTWEWKFLRSREGFLPFFRVNRDIYLRTLCLILVTTFFTSASARMGEGILSANSLMMQAFLLFSYIMDGFAHAAEALTGRFIGGRDLRKLSELVRRLFGWGISLTALFTVFYFFFSDDLLRLLTDKTTVLDQARPFLFWILLIPLAGFPAFLWDGIFIGMTASAAMRNSMFAAMACFFVVYFALTPVWGNNGLWVAFITYLAVRGMVQTFLFRKINPAGKSGDCPKSGRSPRKKNRRSAW